MLLPPSDCIYTYSVTVLLFARPLYSTHVPSAGEVVRYQAKALVTDSTLLAGLLIVLVFVVNKCMQPLVAYLVSN